MLCVNVCGGFKGIKLQNLPFEQQHSIKNNKKKTLKKIRKK